MKKRVMAYLLSAASVYITMGYLTQLFLNMVNGARASSRTGRQ